MVLSSLVDIFVEQEINPKAPNKNRHNNAFIIDLIAIACDCRQALHAAPGWPKVAQHPVSP
jgi:hypothetical protein